MAVQTTPFIPDRLPVEGLHLESMIEEIVSANSALARFDGRLESIPNPKVLLSPLMTQEAVVSSKIEGTQATLEEVLEYEADPGQAEKSAEREEDIEEVINYRKALFRAEENLKERPFNLNLMKKMHMILMAGVRGQDKQRGEFRKTQVWIGPPSSAMEDASYVPPPPLKIMELLDNWEKYYHGEEKDTLVQLGIIHAQFAMIHPFLDGNGRIGRLLIPLFLYEKGILDAPTFYASAYMEKTRDEYYHRLASISEKGDWEGWLRYFLKAIESQAKTNSQKVHQITDLYEDSKSRAVELTGSKYNIQAIDVLFERPIFTTPVFQQMSEIPKPTAYRILRELNDGGMIVCLREASGRRPAIYAYPSLVEIVGTY